MQKPTPKLTEDRSPVYIPAATLEPLKREAVVHARPDVHAPNFINDVAAGRVELPIIPRVVQRLIVALRDADVDTREIGKALGQDPVLSAKVLRLANSAFFAGQRSMASIDAAVARIGTQASIDAAVAMIGTQALNRLIVACGVSSAFVKIPGVDLKVFWRDSLIAATAAQRLAPRLDADPESAYVCGLLHATGHLILCQTYPEISAAMFEGFATLRGADLAVIENDCFGIDHSAAGALWIETLGFPQPVADAVRKAVLPPGPSDGPLDLALRGACILALAVADKKAIELAWAALPPLVRAKFGGHGAKPDSSFEKLYDALLETEPEI